MHKGKLIIWIFILSISAILLFWFFTRNDQTQDTETIPNITKIEETQNQPKHAENKNADKNVTPDDSKSIYQEEEAIETSFTPSENATFYKLTDGSEASYSVQKRFISKNTEIVIGISNELRGIGWVDLENNAGEFIIKFDLSSAATDNPKRDNELLSYFDDTEITLETDFANLVSENPIELNKPFTSEMKGLLTINGIQNEVVFKIDGIVNEKTIKATGTTNIKMTDYNITPPTLAGIYNISDEVTIKFDMSARSTSLE